MDEISPLELAGYATGGNILGSVLGGIGASNTASDEQQLRQNMLNQVLAEGKQAYSDVAPTYQPYMQAGEQGISALGQLGANIGDYDYTPQQFEYQGQVSDFLDPSNEYSSQQAMRALQASQGAQGGLLSGSALKELNQQQFGMGQQGWQQALNNMNQDSNTKYGRFLNFANQTSQAMQNSLNNRLGVANQQTGLGQYGTSGNASARMGVASNAQNAIGNQMNPMAQNQGAMTSAPYATGMGVLNSVFNNDNMNALGQAFPQQQQQYTNQGSPAFGMNANYGQGGYVNPSQGNLNIGGNP